MNRKPATYRTAAQWKTLITEQAQSNQTIKQFCDSKGLTVSTFYDWRRKLNQDSGDMNSNPAASSPLFVELEPKLDIPSTVEHHSWNAELQIGHSIVLRFKQ